MCGILGFISKDEKFIAEEKGLNIKHRGPDDTGYYQSDGLKLIHHRLSILDLSYKGHQPMFSHDERFVIIFNGEIYNHIELRERIGSGVVYKSQSDTETILYAYEKWGVDAFAELNGIFALAIFDTHSKELIVARDPFGVKPLYYFQSGDAFCFGSELKSFLNFPDLDKSIDYSALFNYIQFLWSPGSRTPFLNIHKLDSGTYIRLHIERPSEMQISRYYQWPLNAKPKFRSEKQWVDALDTCMQQAVERQLQADVPVGYFVSGGLDSSLLVAIQKHLYPDRAIKGYTISDAINTSEGFEEDLPFAQMLASHLNIDLEIISSNNISPSDFDDMIWHMDEPQGDAVPLYISAISKLARAQGHVVLISGIGGDDLFAGYRRHLAYSLDPYTAKLPLAFRRFIKNTSRILPDDVPGLRRLKKVLSGFDFTNMNDRLLGYFDWIPTEETRKLFSDPVLQALADYNPHAVFLKDLDSISEASSNLTKQLYLEAKYYLPEHNLNYTDKVGMKHGIEIRVPFLDKDLVELSFSIPDEFKLKGKTTKYILRKLAERYLPPEIIHRKKTGFGGPVRTWIKSEFQTAIDRDLSAEHMKSQGIFNPKAVNQLIQANKTGKRDAAYSILALLAIQSWLRQFGR
ncbi:MAG: asparagine synthase (glutamine-hydrolyzing) [Saprospiraceae bacterium]|nr:asparagine synthase (glutamine-hydrolyzing) [Saprospiraceae bacterium]